MKKLVILLVINLISVIAYSQIEIFYRYTIGGNFEPDINIYGEKKISEKVNLTYFALVEEKWSEALVGVSYSPQNWISFGLSAGIEHNPAIYRFAGSLWLGKNKTTLLLLGEKGNGRDNYWYKTVLSYKLSETFTAGAVSWRFHGLGPIFKFTPKKSDLTFWILPAYDIESNSKRLITGLSVKI